MLVYAGSLHAPLLCYPVPLHCSIAPLLLAGPCSQSAVVCSRCVAGEVSRCVFDMRAPGVCSRFTFQMYVADCAPDVLSKCVFQMFAPDVCVPDVCSRYVFQMGVLDVCSRCLTQICFANMFFRCSFADMSSRSVLATCFGHGRFRTSSQMHGTQHFL